MAFLTAGTLPHAGLERQEAGCCSTRGTCFSLPPKTQLLTLACLHPHQLFVAGRPQGAEVPSRPVQALLSPAGEQCPGDELQWPLLAPGGQGSMWAPEAQTHYYSRCTVTKNLKSEGYKSKNSQEYPQCQVGFR